MEFRFVGDAGSDGDAALAQTVESAGGAAATAASIPDFSGIWGRNWLFLEPPLSGPGPVVSKLRNPDGTMNILAGTVGDYTSPILTPQAVEFVKKNGEMELGGAVLPNPHNECWPEPTPFFLGIQMGIQLIQQKDKITFLYLNDHQVRYVRMNAPHSAHPTPTWQGESVGHYEGDTLVIDTVGQKVGPLSMIDHYGTPYSAALHVIERYRLIDGAMARDLQRQHRRPSKLPIHPPAQRTVLLSSPSTWPGPIPEPDNCTILRCRYRTPKWTSTSPHQRTDPRRYTAY
jgi:hypothetical protein